MYLDHFGLREAPFRITPHTEFFFFGANRGATLEALIYAITRDEGIVKVSGEVGSGKTMFCRMLLERLPDNVETVYLANPSLSRDEMLYAIAEELHAPLPEGRSQLLLRALQERLIEIYSAGRQVVVMIDEAHAMPPETLEEIRLLSNLESNRHKLLHIVLFGQPELDQHLRDTAMRPLKERITHNFALEPLRRSDIGNYLMFRMRAAGYRGPNLFTTGAIERISKASEGLTRRINILADKALLAAFAEDRHLIDTRQIKAAIRDAQFNAIGDGAARKVRWTIAAGALIGILALGAVLFISYRTGKAALPPAIELASANANTNSVDAVTNASDAAPSMAEPAPPENTTVAPAADTLPAPATPAAPAEQRATLAEHIAASEAWLKEAPGSHYVIQLLNTDAGRQDEVVEYLETRVQTLDPQLVHVYRSNLSGRDRIGVVYGDYASRSAANTDLARLSVGSAGGKPYVRSVSKLR